MKKILISIIALLIIGSSALAAKPASKQRQITPDDYVPGMVIIQLKQEMRGKFAPVTKNSKRISFGLASLDGLCAKYGVTKIEPLFYDPNIAKNEKAVKHGLDLMYVLHLPSPTDIKAALKDYQSDPAVDCGMPNVIQKYAATPNDPLLGSQWHLTKVQAATAWDIQQGDSTTILSIVDSGCDWTHQDLKANMWINAAEDINGNGVFDNWASTYDSTGRGFGDQDGIDQDSNGLFDDVVGWDFTDNDNNPYPTGDPADHGTHCYGIANARTNNALGVAGLGWNCRHIGFRCTSGAGIGIIAALNAIYYSVAERSSVISMSWGGGGYWVPERRVLDYAYDNGAVLVAAAGNDNVMDAHYPSAFPNVMAVAATNQSDQKSGASGANSNYGTWVDVSSPGDAIWSTVPNNGYESWYGTSMATPLVAGLVGLVRAKNPSWTNTTIENQILNTCDNIDAQNPAYVGLLGSGRINAYKSLNTAARPKLSYQDYNFAETSGNGNGRIDAGETANLTVSVKNFWYDAFNVQGTLISNDPFVTVTGASSYYGLPEHTIRGGHTRGNNTPYVVSTSADAPNHMADMALHLTADGYDTTVYFNLPIGRSGLLLVNHDDRSRLIWPIYRDAFAALDIPYDYWDWAEWKTPSLERMKRYGTAFLYTEWSFPSLDSTDIDTLKAYLNQGGGLYIGGQDLGWDITEYANVPDCYDPDFYLNYMKANWGGDDAPASSVTGVGGDPIGDGLAFDWDQPYLDPSLEYPDYFNATGGAVDFLKYNTGQNCGLRYSGPYRLVYTGFSPEAVVGDASRRLLIYRILRWLAGDIRISHTPVGDNEDSLAATQVEALITAEKPINISRSALYWMKKSEGIYHPVPFTASDDTFRADIPAPGHPDSIFYFIYAEDDSGYSGLLPVKAPDARYSFYVGPDLIPPAFTHQALPDTMDLIGPYSFSVNVTDNMGVDTSSVKVHYYREGMPEPEDSTLMAYLGNGDYAGTIAFPTWGQLNQHVYYYFTASDVALNHNLGTSSLAGFNLKDSLWIDSFPDTLLIPAVWDTGAGWYGTTAAANPTPPGIRSQRPQKYGPNFENSLTHKLFYDFSPYTGMEMHFRHRRWIAAGDTGHVEVSRDGATWYTVSQYTGTAVWGAAVAAIPAEYCSTANDNDSIRIRFRFKSDAVSDTNFGWYLDDVRIKATGPYFVGVAGRPELPITNYEFKLLPAHPNPHKNQTTISYQLPVKSNIELAIYNVLGQKIRTLTNGSQNPGWHTVTWNGLDNNGRKVSNGVYLYRLITENQSLTKKMVKIR